MSTIGPFNLETKGSFNPSRDITVNMISEYFTSHRGMLAAPLFNNAVGGWKINTLIKCLDAYPIKNLFIYCTQDTFTAQWQGIKCKRKTSQRHKSRLTYS